MKLKIFFLLLIFSLNVHSQNKEPTRGILTPPLSMSDVDGIFGMLVNPSSISFFEGMEFLFLTTKTTAEGNEGGGGYFGGNLIGPLTGGVGIEFLKNPHFNGIFLRLPISLSLKWKNRFAIGLLYSWIYSEKDPSINHLSAFDIGFIYRPASFFSFGFILKDLNSPSGGKTTFNRKYHEGLGFKIYKNLSISVETEVDEKGENFNATGYFKFEPLRGLMFSTGLGAFPTKSPIEWFAGLFLELSFGYADFLGGGIFDNKEGSSFKGATFGFKLSSKRKNSIIEPDDLMVEINLYANLIEGKDNPLLFGEGMPFSDVFYEIQSIADDERVKGVLLKLEGLDITFAQAEELRNLINELKKRGKTVVSYIDSANIKTYYLASSADFILIEPTGSLMFGGISSTIVFISELLNKIGISAQFYPIGKYKNFPEIFERKEPSEESREVQNSILGDIYDIFLHDVSKGRKIELFRLKESIESGPLLSKEAKEKKLVDEVASHPEVMDKIYKLTGKNFSFIRNYESVKVREKRWSTPDKIGVIPVVGTIVDGVSGRVPLLNISFSGDKTLIYCIENMVSAPDVFGIILRIDSPGGSLMATEKINQVLQEAKKHKPVVSIFGSNAASGAYYIASVSDKIFSMKTTLTGSIGIWGGKISFENLFSKIGISTTTFKRGESSDMLSFFRPFSENEIAMIKEKLKYLYEIFVSRVSQGRGLKIEDVSKNAEGRVFTGSQAKQIGLIDEFGGYYSAINYLKKKAGIDEKTPIELEFCPQMTFEEKIKSILYPIQDENMIKLIPLSFLKNIAPFLIIDDKNLYVINPLILIEN